MGKRKEEVNLGNSIPSKRLNYNPWEIEVNKGTPPTPPQTPTNSKYDFNIWKKSDVANLNSIKISELELGVWFVFFKFANSIFYFILK